MDLGKNLELKVNKWNAGQRVPSNKHWPLRQEEKTLSGEQESLIVLATPFPPEKAEAESVCVRNLSGWKSLSCSPKNVGTIPRFYVWRSFRINMKFERFEDSVNLYTCLTSFLSVSNKCNLY